MRESPFYQQLVEEGYLISRERSGHFVNPAMLKGRLGLEEARIPHADRHGRGRFVRGGALKLSPPPGRR